MKTTPRRAFRGQKECRESCEAFAVVRWVFLGQVDRPECTYWFLVIVIPGNCQLSVIAGNSSVPSGQGREGKYLQPLIIACCYSPVLKKQKPLITQSAQSRAPERNWFSKAQINALVTLWGERGNGNKSWRWQRKHSVKTEYGCALLHPTHFKPTWEDLIIYKVPALSTLIEIYWGHLDYCHANKRLVAQVTWLRSPNSCSVINAL